MEVIKRAASRLAGSPHILVLLLVLATLVIHFLIINRPPEPIFDEKYYITDAREILNGEVALRWEHPPLGQLLITFGLFLFGDSPLGWRFFSILFGTISLVLFYLLCGQLRMPKRASLLATFLLALENLTFIQASVAMLDVFSLTFMLAAFYFYLRGSYPLTGVAVCLSTLSKLTGGLTLLAILLHWLLVRRDRRAHFLLSMALAPLLFFELIPLLDFAVTKQFLDPISRINYILTASASITLDYGTHPFASRPWEWILYPKIMPYSYEPYYSGTISFTLWALIIPSLLYVVFRAKKGNEVGLFSVLWFASTYLVWIPLSLITERITYGFYFYPSVGAVSLALGLGLSELIGFGERRKSNRLKWMAIAVTSVYLILHIGVFIILSPLASAYRWAPILWRMLIPSS